MEFKTNRSARRRLERERRLAKRRIANDPDKKEMANLCGRLICERDRARKEMKIAFELGQEDMRERAAKAALAHVRLGHGVMHHAINEHTETIVEAIKQLPIFMGDEHATNGQEHSISRAGEPAENMDPA